MDEPTPESSDGEAARLLEQSREALARGDRLKAIALAREAVALRQETRGRGDVATAAAWSTLASAYRAAGDGGAAVE
ncbi:MAG TPA: hypothetical protein PKW35_13470, partial [Nannocystaceae bacterium]|nr:hypothetical protein [Nannocystaceae bacterium]